VQTCSPAAVSPPIQSAKSATALVAAFGLVLVTFHLATNLIRPYFTAYLMADPVPALSLTSSGLVFLIPSMMALVAMPAIRRLCTVNRLPMVYLSAMALAAAGLFLQTWADNVVLLIGSRMIYGVVIAIGHAALDVRLLMGSRLQDVPANYSWAASAQSIGLLSAPLVATSLVDMSGLAAPLSAGALLCLFNLTVAGAVILRTPGLTRIPAAAALRKE
jgi:DHA1 family multidrug resistance protein-like MFS transporter